ncbi:hypothetical protein [Photorhabdus sp. RM323S]|uniref:hypothetical protein n=1 Tax=Photorhabdus sp. RM323S TaxID=3342828 RepID=UPI0036DED135
MASTEDYVFISKCSKHAHCTIGVSVERISLVASWSSLSSMQEIANGRLLPSSFDISLILAALGVRDFIVSGTHFVVIAPHFFMLSLSNITSTTAVDARNLHFS